MHTKIQLNGEWDFAVDPQGSGFEKQWFKGGGAFKRAIKVPGAWQAQGVGKPEAHLRHHYVGWGWYRRAVRIPGKLLRGRLWLVIGGACVKTKAYVNGTEVGEHDGYSTEFRFDVTLAAHAGRNEIVLAISNLPNSGKIQPPGMHHSNDPTGCFIYMARWGGIYREVYLEATDSSWIEDVYVIPHALKGKIEVQVEVAGEAKGKRIQIEINGRKTEKFCSGDMTFANPPLPLPGGDHGKFPSIGGVATGRGGSSCFAEAAMQDKSTLATVLTLSLPGLQLWSPEEPVLHNSVIRLLDARGRKIDERMVRFGMRDISVQGHQILLNGRPYYINGYGDDNFQDEVMTGFPLCGKETYKRRLLLMKKCGFNAARHHSWVPTPEYFEAADEVGMLVQAELPVVYDNHFLPNLEFLEKELVNILRMHRNHPSFFAVSMGNEFMVNHKGVAGIAFSRTVEKLYLIAKEHFKTGFAVSNSGELLPPSDINVVAQFRIGTDPCNKPILVHEHGGYGCALPDIQAAKLFTGAMHPVWLESKKKWLINSGWTHIYPQVLVNSERLLHLRRKSDMEGVRHQPACAGYYWWLGTDAPGGVEGDAWYYGILDFFGRPKSFQPEEMRQFNNRTLLFTDKGLGRNIWDDEGLRVNCFLSHYGRHEIKDGRLSWGVVKSDGSEVFAKPSRATSKTRAKEGELAKGEINGICQAPGTARLLTPIDIGKYGLAKPEEVMLTVSLKWSLGETHNGWSYWLFPRPKGAMSDPGRVRAHPDIEQKSIHEIYPPLAKRGLDAGIRVIICDGKALSGNKFERRISGFLSSGGRIVFLANNAGLPGLIERNFRQDYGFGYGSFIREHPALSLLPKKKFCDPHYADFFGKNVALLLDSMRRDFEPIAGGVTQRLDPKLGRENKYLAKFGMLLEGRLGKGKIIMTTWNVQKMERPLSRYLVESLTAYALSDDFKPKYDLRPLFKTRSYK